MISMPSQKEGTARPETATTLTVWSIQVSR